MVGADTGPAPDGAQTGDGPRPVTLLLVEDHDVVRRELEAMLTGAGLEVVAAVPTLAAARRAAADGRPDIAVVDTGLPDGSGIDLCRELRSLVPGITTIVHTASVTPDEERLAREAGALAVVLKSIDSRALLRAIGRRSTPV